MSNDENKFIFDFDQAFELILRTYPSMLKSYFDKLIESGFDEKQAMMLTRDYQKVMFGAYRRPDEDN